MMLDLNSLPGDPEQLGLNDTRKFTAREDDGTGLYYYRFRYFHPMLGRFVSEDPVERTSQSHLYRYAENDPIHGWDPLGLFTELLTFCPVGNGRSSFGHTAININGTVYSFGERGWHTESFADYMARNSFRDANGQVLDLSSEQEGALEDLMKKDMGRNPKWTANVNCTTKQREMLNQATNGGLEGAPPTPYPDDLVKLLNQMKVVAETRCYPKGPKSTGNESSGGGSSSGCCKE
jgi:RHS repeat-associated protein